METPFVLFTHHLALKPLEKASVKFRKNALFPIGEDEVHIFPLVFIQINDQLIKSHAVGDHLDHTGVEHVGLAGVPDFHNLPSDRFVHIESSFELFTASIKMLWSKPAV